MMINCDDTIFEMSKEGKLDMKPNNKANKPYNSENKFNVSQFNGHRQETFAFTKKGSQNLH